MTACFGPGDRVRFAGGVGTVAYVEGIGVYVWPDAEQGSKPDWFSVGDLALAEPTPELRIVADSSLPPGQVYICKPDAWQPFAAEHAAAAWVDSRCEKLDLEMSRMPDERRRANELSDRCGALETERRDLLVENATLRRRVEVLERDAKRVPRGAPRRNASATAHLARTAARGTPCARSSLLGMRTEAQARSGTPRRSLRPLRRPENWCSHDPHGCAVSWLQPRGAWHHARLVLFAVRS